MSGNWKGDSKEILEEMANQKSAKKFAAVVAGTLALAVMTGCTTFDRGMSKKANTRTVDLSKKEADLKAAQARIEQQRAALAAREADVKKKEMMAATAPAPTPSGAARSVVTASNTLLPPNPKPGECYARILTPAKYSTSTEKVLKKEAGTRIETIPAKFETVTEKVLVREASTKLEIVPAQYGTVTEKIMVRPESSRLTQVPAQYKTVTEKVLDKAAHTVWKRGAGAAAGAVQTRIDNSTGEIMCLVNVPATYKTITKTVLAAPATVKEAKVPAEYKTVTRTVLKQPESTRVKQIPAEYKTVTVQKMVTPPQTREIPIPAEYQTVTKRKKVSEESLNWSSVLCEVNMTPNVVKAIQNAVKTAGNYRGAVDGRMGPQTLAAVNAWAKSKGLPVGDNYIPMETIQAMGVRF